MTETPGKPPAASAKERLGDYYRSNGESDHLRRLEAALTDEWASTNELAKTADCSPKYAANALPYLLAEQRAEQQRERFATLRGRSWRWTWRRPQ